MFGFYEGFEERLQGTVLQGSDFRVSLVSASTLPTLTIRNSELTRICPD